MRPGSALRRKSHWQVPGVNFRAAAVAATAVSDVHAPNRIIKKAVLLVIIVMILTKSSGLPVRKSELVIIVSVSRGHAVPCQWPV